MKKKNYLKEKKDLPNKTNARIQIIYTKKEYYINTSKTKNI